MGRECSKRGCEKEMTIDDQFIDDDGVKRTLYTCPDGHEHTVVG